MNATLLHVAVYAIYGALPLWLGAWFWRGKARDRFDVLLRLFGISAFFVWAYVLGPWSWVMYPARFGLLVILVLAVIQGFRLLGRLPFLKRKPFKHWLRGLGWIPIGLFCLGTALPAALSGTPDEAPVDLRFPLKGGAFYISQGGNDAGLNPHALITPQRFAIEVTQLEKWGTRAHKPFPTANADFAVFGEPVFSPCTGHVVRVRDGLKDAAPFQSPTTNGELNEEDLAGNHVVIRCKNVDVLLAHLKSDTVGLQEGQPISEGDFVAKVGNSGSATEPHLHLHAQRISNDLSFWSENNAGVPIRFDGRFLRRNDLIRVDP